MQISGANLLLASQQAAPVAPAPGFTSLLQKGAGFTPRDLTKAEPAAPAPDAKPAPSGPTRPGMHIDLKV